MSPLPSLFAFPSALSGFGGTLRIVVLLLPGAGQKRAGTTGAFFELRLRGIQRAKICVRSGKQVGRIVGQRSSPGAINLAAAVVAAIRYAPSVSKPICREDRCPGVKGMARQYLEVVLPRHCPSGRERARCSVS